MCRQRLSSVPFVTLFPSGSRYTLAREDPSPRTRPGAHSCSGFPVTPQTLCAENPMGQQNAYFGVPYPERQPSTVGAHQRLEQSRGDPESLLFQWSPSAWSLKLLCYTPIRRRTKVSISDAMIMKLLCYTSITSIRRRTKVSIADPVIMKSGRAQGKLNPRMDNSGYLDTVGEGH